MKKSLKTVVIISRNKRDFEKQAQKLLALVMSAGIEACDISFVSADRACRADTISKCIADNYRDAELFVTMGDKAGDELAVRIAAKLCGSSLTGARTAEIQEIEDEDECALIASKTIYAGHAIGRFEMTEKPFALSMDQAMSVSLSDELIEVCRELIDRTEVIETEEEALDSYEEAALEASSELDEADVVIVAGRGIGNERNAAELADILEGSGIPLAGTRPCVMNAWLPMSRLIGVSGKLISPKVAILLGVSGAPALYEGIKASQKIISVNTDPDAPVCKMSDLAVIGDCMDIMREFAKKREENA